MFESFDHLVVYATGRRTLSHILPKWWLVHGNTQQQYSLTWKDDNSC